MITPGFAVDPEPLRLVLYRRARALSRPVESLAVADFAPETGDAQSGLLWLLDAAVEAGALRPPAGFPPDALRVFPLDDPDDVMVGIRLPAAPHRYLCAPPRRLRDLIPEPPGIDGLRYVLDEIADEASALADDISRIETSGRSSD